MRVKTILFLVVLMMLSGCSTRQSPEASTQPSPSAAQPEPIQATSSDTEPDSLDQRYEQVMSEARKLLQEVGSDTDPHTKNGQSKQASDFTLHTIKQGETLYGIARTALTDAGIAPTENRIEKLIEGIIEQNPTIRPEALQVQKTILVPKPTPE